MAAWLTGSTSMLVEAAHSLADCGNLGLLVWSTPVAEPPADADYLLEHGGAIYIGLFSGLMLFSVGGMFSIYGGPAQIGAGSC